MSESGRDDPQPLDYANPLKVPMRRNHWVLWLILIVLLLLLLASLLLSTLNPSYSHTAGRVRSASNLRQIGQAILLYTNDFNGDYPDSFATILMDEDVTSGVFVSPERNETPAIGPTTQSMAVQLIPGPHLSYVYLGRGLSIKTVTPDTIVAYELVVPDGTNVLFGDGHVEFFDAKTAAKIVAKASTGKFPVTIPSH
jgi:prepilin-type processing-associated H-X9-DG protein